MRIGAHAVLFKQRIQTETDWIFSSFAEAGYEGVELGSRFFGVTEKTKLIESLERNGIALAGMHVGVPVTELGDLQTAVEKVAAVAKFVHDMPNRNVVMSGSGFEGTDLKAVAKGYQAIAERCADVGAALHYHNHAPEFVNNMEVFKHLVEYAPALYFGVDLGWVYKAGIAPADVVKEYADRIRYVHLRDAETSEGREFAEIGHGKMDIPGLLKTIEQSLGGNAWVIVENEDGPEDMNRYVEARKYLKGAGV
jgi:sugar phosphate isomerase/epimerase